MPDGVTSIGDYALEYCESLTSIAIPGSVKSIGDYALEYCESLESITIPEGVQSIGRCSFRGCSALTAMWFPQSLSSIGESPFIDCVSLENFHVNASNPVYSSLDGVLFNRQEHCLLNYPIGKKEDAYLVPEGTETHGEKGVCILISIWNSCRCRMTSFTMGEGVFRDCKAFAFRDAFQAV